MFGFECWVTNLKLEWYSNSLLLMEGTLHLINSILLSREFVSIPLVNYFWRSWKRVMHHISWLSSNPTVNLF